MQSTKKPKDYSALFKMIIVGDSGVGKSSLMLRKCDNIFLDTAISTIGVDFRYVTITVNDVSVKLQIWDTAGQERFKTITQAYYRSSDGMLVVYDVSNKTTFLNVARWIDEAKKRADRPMIIVLIGNKCDSDKRQVPYEEGKKYADSHNMLFIETSAKSGINVDDAFDLIAKEMLKISNPPNEDSSKVTIVPPTTPGKISICC